VNHYVYRMSRDDGAWYVGVRSCKCAPREDVKYVGSGLRMMRAFKKAPHRWGKRVLVQVETRAEALRIEAALVTEQSLSDPLCFNCQSGGRGAHKASLETRAKMRAAKLGKKQKPEHVAKRAASQTGLKRTPETRANIRAGQSPEARAKMSAAAKGRTKSAETRAKMAASQRARLAARKIQDPACLSAKAG
jgi:hypothetical protein